MCSCREGFNIEGEGFSCVGEYQHTGRQGLSCREGFNIEGKGFSAVSEYQHPEGRGSTQKGKDSAV